MSRRSELDHKLRHSAVLQVCIVFVFSGILWFIPGKNYLGSGVAAQAIEVIMKDVQRVESGLFLEDPMQKITNRGLL